MEPILWTLLGLLGLAELVGATSKYVTISEMINAKLRGKAWFVRGLLMAAWIALGVHLFFGWLQ